MHPDVDLSVQKSWFLEQQGGSQSSLSPFLDSAQLQKLCL